MTLFIDLNTNTFISSTAFKAPLGSVSFKRGDAATVELVFVSGNTAQTATLDKDIVFGIKESGKYDGEYLVSASDYTISGTSHILNPDFNTVALNTLLNSGDEDDTNDVSSVTAMLEVTWSDDSGATWHSTNTISAILSNDVNKGDEATPTASTTLLDWFESYRPSPLVLGSAPVDQSISAIVNPTGADNSVAFTLQDEVLAASITYATPTAQKETSVAVVGSAITVTAGTKARMITSGTTPAIDNVGYVDYGVDGVTVYTSDGLANYSPIGAARTAFYGDGATWYVWCWDSSDTELYKAYITSAAATPDLIVGTWTVETGSGQPTIVAGISSAAQVISAVNADEDAFALVEASASGTVTGAVAAVSITSLPTGTAGKLDQNAIVSETDVYKCVREFPAKWVSLT